MLVWLCQTRKIQIAIQLGILLAPLAGQAGSALHVDMNVMPRHVKLGESFALSLRIDNAGGSVVCICRPLDYWHKGIRIKAVGSGGKEYPVVSMIQDRPLEFYTATRVMLFPGDSISITMPSVNESLVSTLALPVAGEYQLMAELSGPDSTEEAPICQPLVTEEEPPCEAWVGHAVSSPVSMTFLPPAAEEIRQRAHLLAECLNDPSCYDPGMLLLYFSLVRAPAAAAAMIAKVDRDVREGVQSLAQPFMGSLLKALVWQGRLQDAKTLSSLAKTPGIDPTLSKVLRDTAGEIHALHVGPDPTLLSPAAK